jgi:hypothetical protein
MENPTRRNADARTGDITRGVPEANVLRFCKLFFVKSARVRLARLNSRSTIENRRSKMRHCLARIEPHKGLHPTRP